MNKNFIKKFKYIIKGTTLEFAQQFNQDLHQIYHQSNNIYYLQI